VNRWSRIVPDHAWLVIALSIGMTLWAAAQFVDLRSGEVVMRIDASVDRLLPENDASREFYDRCRLLFGSDETIVVAIVTDDVFRSDKLATIARLTRRFEEIPGVHHVLSLANAVNIKGVEDDLEIAPFMRGVPRDPRSLAALRSEVMGNPIYAGNLVSRDARATALILHFGEMTNQAFRLARIDERIEAIADEERGDSEIWITGGPHIRAVGARILLAEALTIPVTMIAVLGGVLALAFRTIRGVVLPLVTIAAAVTWTLGISIGLGYELNLVTSIVPALLTTLGLSYSVHVVSAYVESSTIEGRHPDSGVGTVAQDARIQVAGALNRVAMPVGITALTTVVGFASLCVSPLGAVREFGVLAVIGVCAATLASLTLTPAVLSLLPVARRKDSRFERASPFERFVDHAANFDVSWRRSIFVVFAGLFVVAIFGAMQLKVGTQQIDKFRPDAPVRVHFEEINEHLEGANLIYAVIESATEEGLKTPENLREIEALQLWLEKQPEIGGTTSLVDYVKLVNRGFHGNDPTRFAIPETKRMTSQLLFFGGSDELESFVDSRFRVASIKIRTTVMGSDEITALATRIENRFLELPEDLDGTLTGTSIVLSRTLDSIIRGQAQSLALALGFIYLVLAALFVSFRIALVALIPNVLPVAMFFGALGWSGIRLDPATSLIAPMVLGIAIDDTIHYFTRFVRDSRLMGDERRATVSALRYVGRPVTYTSVALCLGFGMLNMSELQSNADLGSLAAFALGVAWLSDFTLTPALCVRLRVATIWDLLRLDLGPSPHTTIQLFRGMSATQSRVVALMATLVEVSAGRRLFNAGEGADAIYLVIHGSLHESALDGTGRIDLAVHHRGGMLGEVGVRAEQRIADVDVLEDTRLLRLTVESVEALDRQNPKIAMLLHRNLNEFLAHRMSMVTTQTLVQTGMPLESPKPNRTALESKAQILDAAFYSPSAKAVLKQWHDGVVSSGSSAAEALIEEDEFANRLLDAGVDHDTLTALTLVPLVEVAWADGRMDDEEKVAVMEGARVVGFEPGSPSFRVLEMWLENPPTRVLTEAWQDYIRAACQVLSVESCIHLEASIIGRARDVAEAAGGVLGFGTVSRVEARVLARLAEAFKTK
jgi:predicted RND superfamily exporter protein/CRP-like cAMP-binding protein